MTTFLCAAKTATLSDEQEQLWFMHQLRPDAPPDSERVTLTVRGELDQEALRKSLAAFIGRHEIWRTIFPSQDGVPGQVVQAQGQWAWTAADLTGLAAAQREQEALRRAEADATQLFDLARGPLVRALLVRLGEQEHRLFMTVHPIICDRESLTHVFAPELRELYEARMHADGPGAAGGPPAAGTADLPGRDAGVCAER
jgi:hypothetical protein